ncbi:MAG: hypothetical protein KAJ19_15560 [Gammaproteobacteria bacterium]|nr:hypothetical protein [Gammaproteobacteria bacterium]
MNIQAYAKAKADAIDEIGRKTGIDLNVEAMPMRAPEPKILELFRLQKIARELPENPDEDDVVEMEFVLGVLSSTKGIGTALYERLEIALLGE